MRDFEAQLEKLIEQATEHIRLEFGLDICKRLFPYYENFYAKHNWGSPSKLKEAIDFIESFINHQVLEEKRLLELIIDVDKVIPDSEDYGDLDGSFALNSGVSVHELLCYLNDKDTLHLTTISSMMTDTIDFKIQENNPNFSDTDIFSHDLMVKEFDYQLNKLKS